MVLNELNEVLNELGVINKEMLLVLNKIDKATEEQISIIKEAIGDNEVIEISAKEGTNLEEFLSLIEEKLPYNYRQVEYLIPYEKGDIQSFLHRNSRVIEEEYKDNGTYMLAEVDDEVYNKTTDDKKRTEIYHLIDSVSGVASTFAIANEYDKMLMSIGAQGTNAFTSLEQTVYVNDVAQNQISKWLTIEAERFRAPVLRLFHTELEAVYEEKNISLDNDGRKVYEALLSKLIFFSS